MLSQPTLIYRMMDAMDSVVIGFGTASGAPSKTLLSQKYHVIERLNMKAKVSDPKVSVRRFEEIDLGIFKGLISKRRNQMLLSSFIGLHDASNDEEEYIRLRKNAQQQIKSIDQELGTISYMSEQNKVGKFIDQTGATQREAQQYLQEFRGALGDAVVAYGQRATIVKSFAEKHKMPLGEAKALLKANNYITEIFE